MYHNYCDGRLCLAINRVVLCDDVTAVIRWPWTSHSGRIPRCQVGPVCLSLTVRWLCSL